MSEGLKNVIFYIRQTPDSSKIWSPGLVVKGGYLCFKGNEFEVQHLILDGHFFTIICCKNCNVCLKRHKYIKKRLGVAIIDHMVKYLR